MSHKGTSMNDYKAKIDEAVDLLNQYNAALIAMVAENDALKTIIEAQKGIIKAYEAMYKQEDNT
jgi:hypothetical protein